MVRLLAAIIVAAWSIRASVDRRMPDLRRLPPRSVVIALVAVLGAQLLSTLFSINPRASFSVEGNSRGLVTSLSEAVLFLAVAGFLRRPSQLERLVSALIATSVPVAIYAIIQRASFDPIAFAGSGERVFSTLGHPIFLAAYLATVMPLTWWKIMQVAKPGRAAVAGQRQVANPLFLTGVALVQVVAFVCAQSRGPLLGLFATASFFGLGWALCARKREWLFRIGGVITIALGFLVFLNLPLPASTRVAHTLGMERFAESLGLRKGADPFRKAHWNAAVEIMTSSKPIVFPDGGSDHWYALRPWIGYGPETLVNVLSQRYLWPSTDLKPESRLHNRILDLWWTTGAFGVLAFLAFFVLVFRHGLALVFPGSRRTILVSVPGAAIAFGALACAIGGKAFFGLGIIAGIVAGCAVGMLMAARNARQQPGVPEHGAGPQAADTSTSTPTRKQLRNSEDAAGHQLLVIALLAALVGHLLETAFAFPVPATSLQFWVYAGMLLAIGCMKDSPREAPVAPLAKGGRQKRSPNGPGGRETAVWDGRMAAFGPTLILVTLVFAFLQMYSVDTIDWLTVLTRTLAQIKGDQGPSHLVLFLFVPTWLATSFVFAGVTGETGRIGWWAPLAISAAVAGLFTIVQSAQIAAIGPLPRVTDSPAVALAQIPGYQSLYFGFVGTVLVLVFGEAWMINSSAATGAKWTWRPVAWNALAIGLGFASAWFVAFREIHGEITGTWGRTLKSFDLLEAGTEVLERAVHEMPDSIFYRRELGAAYIRRAQASHEYETFDWFSRQAEASLLPAAAEVHGMSTAGADLARLYLPWAAFTMDPERRLWLARQAGTYFERQQRFAPSHPVSWVDSAVLHEFIHQPQEADRQLQVGVGLMDWRLGYWADAYRELSLGCSAPELRQAYATVVFRLFDAAIRKSTASEEVAHLRMKRATLKLGLGEIQEARQECEEIRPSLPANALWEADAALAEVDRQMRDFAGATELIDKAIRACPVGQKADAFGGKSAESMRGDSALIGTRCRQVPCNQTDTTKIECVVNVKKRFRLAGKTSRIFNTALIDFPDFRSKSLICNDLKSDNGGRGRDFRLSNFQNFVTFS